MPLPPNRFVPMPYADPLHNYINGGQYSFYLQPWRCYMDTWPASWLLDSIGINFKEFQPYQVTATAQVIGAAGFTHARVEVGWGNFSYTTPSSLTSANLSQLTTTLTSLKNNGIRPLILLNTNSLVPCPNTSFTATLQTAASTGQTSITIDTTSAAQVVPGKTGLSHNPQNTMAYPLITAVNTSTGVCQLSTPLTANYPSGALSLSTLLYHPFSGPFATDGVTTNPWSAETFNAWSAYILNCCSAVSGILGNNNFDVEIYNELTFGSAFLDEKNYYTTAPNQSPSLVNYSNWGQSTNSYNSVLYLYLLAPAADTVKANFSGVKVINGFSNVVPWGTAMSTWKTVDACSRHFYTGPITIRSLSPKYPRESPVNVLGANDGTVNGQTIKGGTNQTDSGSFFVPNVDTGLPEFNFTGLVQNSLIYFVQGVPPNEVWPLPDGGNPNIDSNAAWVPGTLPIAGSQDKIQASYIWRGSLGFWGQTCGVWETETNYNLFPFSGSIHNAGLSYTDQRLINAVYWMEAKNLLRYFVFHNHKGVQTLMIFACSDLTDKSGLSVIPQAFFNALPNPGGGAQAPLNATAQAAVGPAIQAITNLTTFVKANQGTITSVVPLTVTSICEYNPQTIFNVIPGDPSHPDRMQGDDFFVGPYQASDKCYLIPFYVVTWQTDKNWKVTPNIWDTSNYQMPDQRYDVCLTGFATAPKSCTAYDPMTNLTANVPFTYTNGTLTVGLTVTDYPRFLNVQLT